jgi:hypothetical protein
MIRAHQPGSQPIDIPEVIPNPAVVPKQEPERTRSQKAGQCSGEGGQVRDYSVLQRGSHDRRGRQSASANWIIHVADRAVESPVLL